MRDSLQKYAEIAGNPYLLITSTIPLKMPMFQIVKIVNIQMQNRLKVIAEMKKICLDKTVFIKMHYRDLGRSHGKKRV